MPTSTRPSLAACAGALLACCGCAFAADDAMPVAPTDLAQPLASLRTAPLIAVSSLGQSREGRDIPLITLGDPATRDANPALLIVAGLNGDHWIGTDVAVGVAKRLADEHAEALKTTTVYIVPRVNPDAAAAHTSSKVRASRERTTTSTDADHDRRADEDGPEDLNNDGMITQMRVKNPPAYLKATHVLDPDAEGLLREADESKGEVAVYAVLTEGLDNDDDGKFNEDAPGGVDLDMNFPNQWPEHQDGAGEYPLSEPESLALATFLLDHPRIEAVLAFGPHDTLTSMPQAGKMDVTGRAPLGIENDDKPAYERLSKAFKDVTGMNGAGDRDDKGSFWSWAYTQGNVWAFSTPVWARPDQIKREDEKKDEGDDAAPSRQRGGESGNAPARDGPSDADLRAMIAEYQAADDAKKAEMMASYNDLPPAVQARIMAMGQGGAGGGGGGDDDNAGPRASGPPRGARGGASAGGAGGGGSKKSDSDDAKWLALSKERGEGFVAWTPFNHPQLGEVEIGGFAPGFRMNPPASEVDRLVGEQTAFAAALIDELPRLTFDAPTVEKVGEGVYRVTVVARNGGKLPTASAMAVKSRTLQPLAMRMEGDEKTILAGDRVQRAASIAGGGHARFEWLVAGREGAAVTVTARSPLTGERKIAVPLRAATKDKEGAR